MAPGRPQPSAARSNTPGRVARTTWPRLAGRSIDRKRCFEERQSFARFAARSSGASRFARPSSLGNRGPRRHYCGGHANRYSSHSHPSLRSHGDLQSYDGHGMLSSLLRLAAKVPAPHRASKPSQPNPSRELDLSSIHGSLPRDDLCYLLQVIDVVACKQAHHVLDRFLTALGMHPVVLPLRGLERFKQRKIGFP